MFNVNSLSEDEKFALLFGIMSGDGCLSLVKGKKKFISIKGSWEKDLDFFVDVLYPLICYFREKHTNIKFREVDNSIEFNFIDFKLFDTFSSVGFPIGKKGQKLLIPQIFYDKNLVNYVVAGFFATDGSLVLTKNPNKFYPRLESGVIHEHFLKQVYDYLISIGMNGGYYKRKFIKERPWKVCQDQYRIQFNGLKNLLLFEKMIGLVNPRYKVRFDEFLNYSKDYDKNIFGVSPKNVKKISMVKNKIFVERMALGGF